ncbi:protein argonaute 2 isoform X3 [Hevea brasiliensis]|uniref:protein argonaute 2 isoform X3 n=1 Tax=Hevea brasiliensis TaxID=3981 RepID=UPI0025CC62BC|nr:protein argonaute 2 isoform X3 [Hevea brasiliensis]
MERYSAARGRGTGGARNGEDGGRGRGRGRGRGGDHQYRTRHHQQQNWVSGQDGRTQTHWQSSPGQGGPGSGFVRPARGGHGGSGGAGGGREDWGPAGGRFQGTTSTAVPVHSLIEPHNSSPEKLSVAGKSGPINRPDNGGRNDIRHIRLFANHFLLNYNSGSIIRHYDIDVKPDLPSKNGPAMKFPKAVLSMIRNKLFSDDPDKFPLSMTAYDGEKNIFSAVPLPTGSFKVELLNEEGMKIRHFRVEVQLVNELQFCKLDDYISGKTLSIPRDVLQALDVVMKENPARQMIYACRSFHPTRPYPQDDLGRGITASRGIKYSLKPTTQGLALCLDYSVFPFRKQMPVIDFLKEQIPDFNLNSFRRFRKQVEKVLKGLKVTVTHRTTNQKYKIAGLTDENTQDISFDVENPSDQTPLRKVSLVSYFREKYNKEVMHNNIPSLDLAKSNRKNYVPMEFCMIAGGQRYAKELLDKKQSEKLRGISLAWPKVRESTIYDMVHDRDGPCIGDIPQNFGIGVDLKMTRVIGRVIKPPWLKLGTSKGRWTKATVDRVKCDWNLKRNSVISSKPIRLWGILDFGSSSIEKFIPELISRSERLDIHMEQPLFYKCLPMNLLYEVDDLHQLLKSLNNESYEIGGAGLQIIVCVMPKEDPGYNNLKWISETKVGILTQCCLTKNCNTAKDQFLANLALKINAKLGGSNVELIEQPHSLQSKGHVMFVGADVNHPGSYNSTSPSIAAVVGTMNWPAANQYIARICPQDHRAEKILKFGGMCMELVNAYTRLNQVRPETIVLFRHGVSDGQFDMVLNEELMDLKMTFEASNYFPTITVVVAQKRHKTRLFPESDKNENVPPGTVVDTKITHPIGFDFYLCSHYGAIGTSKPAHCQVLLDENRFTSDELEELTYGMCFTCAQCTKPVSLVPPVLYADRAAYRGRLYHDSIEWYQSSASPSSSSAPSRSPMTYFDEQLYKLHPNLENSFFFI